jgi:hypothetical protein
MEWNPSICFRTVLPAEKRSIIQSRLWAGNKFQKREVHYDET